MKIIKLILVGLAGMGSQLSAAPNPQFFDYSKFEEIVLETHGKRKKSSLNEREFLKAMNSGEYLILDARSFKNFKLRHIKGAKNLPLTEFTERKLKEVIPSKETKVLIYCNNNFTGAPVSFASKMAPASLNITTQVHLRAYGYENIFELEPTIDIKKTSLPFVGKELISR